MEQKPHCIDFRSAYLSEISILIVEKTYISKGSLFILKYNGM